MASLRQTAATSEAVLRARARALDRLATERFDVLVIGGGIVGAGVATLAAEQGLGVALVDMGDFASGTSSASSKLIHGGLRYLRMGDFRLVREALQQERALVTKIAPHLVRRLRFLLPVYGDGPYGRAAIGSALVLYRALAGQQAGRVRVLGPRAASARVPSLRLEQLRGAGLYSDAQTNDARLCLATLRAAAGRGATLLNYAEVTEIDRAGGRDAAGVFRVEIVSRVGEERVLATTRAVVNATGPWVDAVRRLEDPRVGPSVTLSKGAHLVLEQQEAWSTALTVPVDRSRVSFAIPWEGVLLLGTTDEAFDADPGAVSVTPHDERQILAEAGRALIPDVVRPEAVRGSFAGVRVLPLTRHGTPSARRETTIRRGRKGMITVCGGKLTTFRVIAADVLDHLRGELGLGRIRPTGPVPGAADPVVTAAALLKECPALSRASAELLARSYGSLASEVLRHGHAYAEALEQLVPGAPELVAQVLYAREHEWAVTVNDVLRRRTTLALRGLDTAEVRARVESLLAT